MGHVELSAKNSTSIGEASKGKGDVSMGEKMCIITLFGTMMFFMLGVLSGPSSSSIYIKDVYVPALALGTNGTTPFNASIFVDLEFRRMANAIDVFTEHHEYEMAVFYRHGAPAAGCRIPAFRMGRHTTVRMIAAAMEAPELPWGEALREVSAGSTVDLMVEIGMVGSIKSVDVLTEHVEVDASGHMIYERPVYLGECGKCGGGCFRSVDI